MTSLPNVNVDFDFGAEQRRMRRSPDRSVAPAIINGKYEYDPTVWNNATEAVRAKMESPSDYRTRLEAEAYIERLKKTQFPDQYRQQQAELQQFADANEYITQLKLDAEGRDSFMANVQDLGTSIWDFLGVQAPSLAMRVIASPDDVEFQEAIDELQSGEIYRSSFVETARNVLSGVGLSEGMTGGSGITRTPEELANRFNNPEGWGRKVGQAAGSALLSAAAILEPTPFGEMAVLASFGVMGVGSGFEKYDEIVRKNNIDSSTRDRLLVGLGYAAAEVGAEYIGLGIAKSGAKRLGIAMASKTARAVGAEVIEKGVAAGVKRWGNSIGVSLFTGGISEGMEEALTQVAQNHIDILADPGQNWSRAEALEGTVDAFVMGAVAGGMVVGPAIYSKSRTEAKKYAALGEALLEDRDVAIAEQAEAAAEEAEADVVEQQPEVQPSAIVVKDADGEVREAYPYDETDDLSLEAAESQADELLQQLGPAGQNWTTEKATPEQYAEIIGATAVAEETTQVVEEVVPEQAEAPVVDQPVAEEPVVELDPVQQQQQQDRQAEIQIDTAVREARGLDPLAEGEQPMVRIIPEEEETNQPKILTKLREVAAKTSEGTGVPLRIVQVDTQAGEQAAPFDGLYYGNTIYVDANRVREGETAGSDKVFTRILAHELLHATKDVNPELYEHMVKRLGKKKLGRMAVKYAERLGNGEYARMNPEAQIEEALAQAFESDLAAIANGTFSGDRTLAGKIVDFVRQTADRLGLRGGFKKDLDSIVRQLAEGKSLQDLKLASMKPGKPQAQAETRPEVADRDDKPEPRLSPAEDYGFADVEPLPVKTLTSKLQPALDVVDNRVWGKEELKKHLKQKHSVKDDELEWSGFNEYLEGVEGERVSLDDVREAVNEVELTEYTLGGPFLIDMSIGDPIDVSEEAGMPMEETTITAHIPSVLDDYGLPQEFQYAFGVDLMSNDAGVYRVEDREAMTDLWTGAAEDIEQAYEAIKRDVYDRMGVSAESIGQGDTSYEEMQLEGGEDYKELLLRWNPTEGEFLYPEHWMFENILLHVRHNTRYDEDGNKILFLEEVQSDWHQQGRKNGYNKPVARPSNIPSAGELFMPDAPFKNSWKELAMKRMIAHAVANDFDGIAWTTGEQQAERSRKQITDNVSQIVVKSQGEGRYRLEGYGTTLYEKDNLTDNQLADIIGVDLAKDAVEKIAAGEDQVSYDTEDITIGATGHRMFYDPPVETIDPDTGKKKKSGGILWNATTKVTKKYGVKPEVLQIDDVGPQPGVMLNERLVESVSENMQPMFSPAPLTESVMPRSLEEIAGDNTSMWGSLFMVRDKLTDFNKWRMSMLERYPDMTREELFASFTDAVLLSNYITDITDNKLVLKRHTKEELVDIESLKRRFRYATGTARMVDEFRTGVKVGAAREISRLTEKLERLKESVRSKRESVATNQKLFNEIIREAGMSSGKLDKIIANADVRRRQFETEEQLQAAIDASLEAIDSFHRKEAQKSLRRTMKQISKAKFRPEFDSRVAKLLDDAGLTEKMYTKTERARLGSVLAFIDSMTNEELEELALPQSVRNQAEAFRGSKKDISELNAEEAIALRDALRAVIHLNRLKNKLIRVGKERDYARTASAIRVELERATAQVPLLGRSEEQARQENIAVRQIRNFYNSVNLLTPDRFAIWWSGGRDTEFYQRAYVDIADGKREMLRQYQQDQDYLREGLKQVGVDPDTQEGSELLRSMSYDMNNRITRLRALVRAVTGKGKFKDAVPFMKSRGLATEPNLLDIELESGKVLQLTRAERIDLLCHFSDLDTRASIENGSPIQVGSGTNRRVYTLTAADIRNIEQYYDNLGEVDIERQISEILLSRYNGSMRVAVQSYSVDHLGYDITKDSTYYPRRRVRTDGQGKEVDDPIATPSNYVEKTLDNLSITKDRRANNRAIRVRDALTVYNNHSYMVAGLSHLAAPIRNLHRLMSDQSLTDFLRTRKGGDKVITYYDNLLADLVKEVNGGMSRGSLDDRYSSGKLLTSIARSVTVGSLGVNPRVMLYQTASLIAASSEMPARYVTMGARSLADRDVTKEIEMYSPNLRERFASTSHGLVSEGLSDSPNNPLVQERKFSDLVMSGISKFDEFAIRSIWSGTKQWVRDDIKNGVLDMEVGSQEYWAEVTRRADDVVHKTQPTMDFLHLSGFARRARGGSAADRLLNMFSSQRHKNINMQADALIKMRNGDATGALRGTIAHTILQPLLLWGIRGTYGLFLGSGVTSLWSMAFGSGKMEPEWEEEEDKNEMWLLGGIVDNVISTNFGNLPIGDYFGVPLRKGINSLIGYEADYYDPSMSPVYGVVEGATKSTYYLVDQILAEDKSPDLNDYLFTATRVGQLFGVPTHAVNEIRKVYNDSQSSGAIDVIRKRRSELYRMRNQSDDKSLPERFEKELNLINRYYNNLKLPNGQTVRGINSHLLEAKEQEELAKKHEGTPRGERHKKAVQRALVKANEQAKKLYEAVESRNERDDRGR